jgi:hypothetical protein
LGSIVTVSLDEPPQTGNAIVDAACATLSGLAELPIDDHVELLTAAHEQVSSVLQHAPLVALPTRR